MYYHFIPTYLADSNERFCRLEKMTVPELGNKFTKICEWGIYKEKLPELEHTIQPTNN